MKYLDEFERLPEFLPFPRFLVSMEISYTAKMLYVILMDRFSLSKKNNWRDEEGHIYILFTIENLVQAVGRGRTAVTEGLSELEKCGMILRKKKARNSRIYVMIPDDAKTVRTAKKNDKIHFENERQDNWQDWIEIHEKSGKAVSPEKQTDPEIRHDTDPENRDAISPENRYDMSPENRDDTSPEKRDDIPEIRTADVRESDHEDPGKADTSYNDSIQNQKNQTNTDTVCAYGVHGNVMLTAAEYGEFERNHGDIFPAMLDFLSDRIRTNAIPDEPHGVILRRMLE